MLWDWVTGIGASETKGVLGFVPDCLASVETSVHCSAQLRIIRMWPQDVFLNYFSSFAEKSSNCILSVRCILIMVQVELIWTNM